MAKNTLRQIQFICNLRDAERFWQSNGANIVQHGIEFVDSSYSTLLHCIVSNPNQIVSVYFLERIFQIGLGYPLIEVRDINLNTPLHKAVLCGNLQAIEYLVGCGANVNASKFGKIVKEALLNQNCKELVLPIMSCLLSSDQIDLENIYDSHGNNVLHIAVYNSLITDDTSLGLLKMFNQSRPDVFNAKINSSNCCGHTVLMDAAKNGKYKTAQYLLEQGSDLHAVDSKGRSAMWYAQHRNDIQVIKVLGSGMVLDCVDHIMGLQQMVDELGDLRDAGAAKAFGVKVVDNIQEGILHLKGCGMELLRHVVCHWDESIASKVLWWIFFASDGVKCDISSLHDAEGNTLLHYAVLSSSWNVALFLICNGISLEHRNYFGFTPESNASLHPHDLNAFQNGMTWLKEKISMSLDCIGVGAPDSVVW